ncbi:rhodanese-like domain-containing protein [Pelobacter propionicus]|uniref:Rhodanese domain protein n=1 Tax=Pelobacter propionicus (strain DSM 2379 / NBRC 103807 / OttBd1) TaxID=338966 RepID=A1AT70_PELPD|nr:rhodanese-like domain-containing protein [Pelobacter propionicus]ABL00541.1 Rhodanese domain protein [Pelobacter propionicus DSM 2379]
MPGFVTRLLLVTFMLLLPLTSARAETASKPSEELVIDVRSEAEWRQGHLENAILIPYDRIGTDIARFTGDKNARLYLYCRSGRRTAIAAKALTRVGYRNLVNLGTMENAARTLKRRIISETAAP